MSFILSMVLTSFISRRGKQILTLISAENSHTKDIRRKREEDLKRVRQENLKTSSFSSGCRPEILVTRMDSKTKNGRDHMVLFAFRTIDRLF